MACFYGCASRLGASSLCDCGLTAEVIGVKRPTTLLLSLVSLFAISLGSYALL